MSVISPTPPADVYSLPSLPPSPSAEEDLSRIHVWHEGDDEDSDDAEHVRKRRDKRKGKERASGGEEAYAGLNDSEESLEKQDTEGYPPTNDDINETRRVEETLRQWELAERQRRKAAREATPNTTAPSSLVDNVTKRASLLWPVSNRKSPYNLSRKELGDHAVLRSRESLDVPMNDLHLPPSHPASRSTSPTPSTPDITITSAEDRDDTAEDPFTNPIIVQPSPKSPFDDPQGVEQAKEGGQEQEQEHKLTAPAHDPESLLKPPGKSRTGPSTSKRRREVPPPRPLGLPPPRTPPPPLDLVTPEGSGPDTEEDPKEVRWWHEWLCGCGEGPDRGGDSQAGRTNPFE